MGKPAIGIDLQDLRIDTKSALQVAAQMGFSAVEVPAAEGETTPKNLSSSGRRHLQRIVRDLGLDLSALTADFPGIRLSDSRTMDERVERTCTILELAADLAVPIVTASVGALTHPETGEPSETAVDALRRIGEFADSRGRIFAIRPSHDTAERLARVLKAVGCPLIRIGFDPGALLMSGLNPMSVLNLLTTDVALIHLRDGVPGGSGRPGMETRIGEGEVDFRGLAQSIRDYEIACPLIVRRNESANPVSELSQARDYAGRLLSPYP